MNDNFIEFCFVHNGGGAGIESFVKKRIHKDALAALPDSFLSKLSHERWRQKTSNEEDDRAVPSRGIIRIPVDIDKSPCEKEWKPEMADLIQDIYVKAHEEKKRQDDDDDSSYSRPKLPHGVECEDALVVLDFFELSTGKDPAHVLDVSDAEVIVQIRANLFFRDFENAKQLVESILKDLRDNPCVGKHYVMLGRNECDLQLMNKINSRIHTCPLVPMGSVCDGWSLEKVMEFEALMEKPRGRDMVTSTLEAHGLEAEFVPRHLCDTGALWDDHITESGKSCVGIDVADLYSAPDYYDCNWELLHLWVLRVMVPSSTPATKKRQEDVLWADPPHQCAKKARRFFA